MNIFMDSMVYWPISLMRIGNVSGYDLSDVAYATQFLVLQTAVIIRANRVVFYGDIITRAFFVMFLFL